MKPIFVSYTSTSKERANAERLRIAFKEEGIETWVESEFIQSGEQWENALQERLRQTAAVVFLIGPDGLVSEQQRDEATAIFRAQWGTRRKIPLIPVVMGEAELPPFLRQFAAIKIEDIETGWAEVAQKIKHSLSTGPVEVAAPAASSESDQKGRLLEIRQFADSLRVASESSSQEKFVR